MSKPESPPAFPMPAAEHSRGGHFEQYGMSLRDWYAGRAPIGFNMVCKVWGSDDPALTEDPTRAGFFAVWAMLCFEWADAMLAERGKDQP